MKELPRVHLALLPTPLEPLPRLSRDLGGPELWVKRDDLTGLAFGGNKTRKLEFLCAAAEAEDADLLITAGAVQSNHCRQTAAAAAKLGLDCILVLVGEPPPMKSANLLLNGLLGAEIRWSTWENRDAELQRVTDELRSQGRKPYLIPYGGSNALGAAAYAHAMDELLKQEIDPDWIVFASSSGGTQAGLLAGARVHGFRGNVLGISVDEPSEILLPRIANLAIKTLALLGETEAVSVSGVQVNDHYIGAGYAVMGDSERESIELFANLEGILLDPVYTGRAAAGLVDLIRNNYFEMDAKILFWHTGGTPALFADAYQKQLTI
ncbi:MAG: D-cysteine desulfhydrase family protein [Anaerolineales bacterium]